MPCLYNGIVRRSLLDDLRAGSVNGVLFNSLAPDVFSGIVLSQVVGNYLYTNYPFSVNGASHHSIGTSFMRPTSEAAEKSPKTRFLEENACTYDSRLLLAPSIVSVVMGEYMQARKYLPDLKLPEPSWANFVRNLLKSAKNSQLPDEIYTAAAHTIKCLNLEVRLPTRREQSRTAQRLENGTIGDNFNFIVPREMVTNVFDACRLVAGMLPSQPSSLIASPVSDFAKRLTVFAMSELKLLYRSMS